MKRSKHNLSHTHLTTCDMGQLIPITCVEVLPGDTIQHHANVLIRVSPLAAPVMHPVTARVHHFFVPNRLVWSDWEDFITGGPDGDNADTVPTIPHDGIGFNNRLLDYFGIPDSNASGAGDSHEVNELPIRAYNKIFNEFYRDQDLITEVAQNSKYIQNVAWGKDYFNTARPWTQKGSDVTIPLGSQAPVTGIGMIAGGSFGGASNNVKETGGGTSNYAGAVDVSAVTNKMVFEEDTENPDYPNIYADLANATGANINDVRRAFAIQRYQEARARYGSRYTEYLRYLGVKSGDARLQRPEYLGGGQVQLNFSEVMQTGGDSASASNEYGVGDMYGHGIAAMRSNKYRRFIPEHGHIISLLSVRPKSIYTNGIHRMWNRQDKEDYFQKELQHIGQQEVLNKEVYADGTDAASKATGEETFGYTDRYREYREHPSLVSAEFRDVLNYWHMGREFSTTPTLNEDFVKCVPTKRIHNVQTENALWVMCQHKMVARRLVSRNATAKIF